MTDKGTLTRVQTDGISDKDLLGRKKFAEEIADSVLHHFENSTESLAVGIHGPWGSGKSNLLHFIKQQLCKSSHYTPEIPPKPSWYKRPFQKQLSLPPPKTLLLLEFNPWMFAGKEALQRTFLHELALKVQGRSHKLKAQIEDFTKAVEGDGILGMAQKAVAKFLDTPVEKVKEKTNQILVDERINIVIIIDDIDRLAPSEMLEIFQLVKLNANFKNTVFLVSFDKRIVNTAIKNNYGYTGEEYLEKIVQVDFSMPSIPEDVIESMFFERLQNYLDRLSITFNANTLNPAWFIHGLKLYFNTIRDLNRYFNSIAFRLPSINNSVNLHDFLLIESVRLFDFRSYEVIRNNYKEAKKFGDDSRFKRRLELLPSKRARQIYEYLFAFSIKSGQLPDEKFRIRDVEYFDRYFTLTTSTRDTREDEFKVFVHYPHNRLGLLKSLIENRKIDYLLRRIAVKPESFEGQELRTVISPLLSVWGDYIEEFAVHWRTVWSAIKAISNVSGDRNESYRMLLDEFNVSTAQFSPARFTFLWLILENVYREDVKNIDPDLEPLGPLFESQKAKLESDFKHRLQNSWSLFLFSNDYPELYQRIFLQSYSRLEPEKYKEQLRHLVNDDNKVFFLLKKLVFWNEDTSDPVMLNRQLISRLLPGDFMMEFSKRLKNINPKTLSKENAVLLEFVQDKILNDHDRHA